MWTVSSPEATLSTSHPLYGKRHDIHDFMFDLSRCDQPFRRRMTEQPTGQRNSFRKASNARQGLFKPESLDCLFQHALDAFGFLAVHVVLNEIHDAKINSFEQHRTAVLYLPLTPRAAFHGGSRDSVG